MSYRILAIYQHSGLKDILRRSAAEGNYDITTAKSGSQGIQSVADKPPDMILIDIALPDIDGLMCLKLLRETKEALRTPIIILSEKYSEEGMAQAFDLGADDYVSYSDLDPKELTARMRTVARRRLERSEHIGVVLESGPILLDTVSHICKVRGATHELRPREFELLEILIRKAGRVLSRAYLLESVWGMSNQADTRAVDVTISRLRQALGRRAGKWVETVERFGYRFRSPDE